MEALIDNACDQRESNTHSIIPSEELLSSIPQVHVDQHVNAPIEKKGITVFVTYSHNAIGLSMDYLRCLMDAGFTLIFQDSYSNGNHQIQWATESNMVFSYLLHTTKVWTTEMTSQSVVYLSNSLGSCTLDISPMNTIRSFTEKNVVYNEHTGRMSKPTKR